MKTHWSKSVSEEDVIGQNGRKEPCMVVKFAEKDVKPLICNVTNAKTIENRGLGGS